MISLPDHIGPTAGPVQMVAQEGSTQSCRAPAVRDGPRFAAL